MYQLIGKTPGVRKLSNLSTDQIQTAIAGSGGDDGAAATELEVSVRALRHPMTQLLLRYLLANRFQGV